MNTITLPWIVEPQQLESLLHTANLCIVDLCKADTWLAGHVPGAVHLEYNSIISAKPPVMGLLPDASGLAKIAVAIGLTPETRVVAYDDEGGGKAARLLWTLEIMGHKYLSLLNGGLHAWTNEGHQLERTVNQADKTDYPVEFNNTPVAERDFILEHLKDDSVALLDTRSPAEYTGMKKFAARGGHIPGAINIDWTEAMDQGKNLRIKPEAELRDLLEARGITPDKTVVAYCHTNHRSAYIYFVLKALEYPDIKAYPGSWSDWGNASDTPVEP